MGHFTPTHPAKSTVETSHVQNYLEKLPETFSEWRVVARPVTQREAGCSPNQEPFQQTNAKKQKQLVRLVPGNCFARQSATSRVRLFVVLGTTLRVYRTS